MDEFEIGKFLRDLRKNKGLTMKEFGSLTGLSQPYLSQIENGQRGKPSPEILKKYSSALDYDHFNLMAVAGYIEEDDLLEPVEEIVRSGFFTTRIQNGKTGMMKMMDLAIILEQENLFYKNLVLTQNDRKRILDMLDIMFQPKEDK